MPRPPDPNPASDPDPPPASAAAAAVDYAAPVVPALPAGGPPPDLSRRAAGGVLWTGGYALLGKVVSTVCQVALAALLGKADFGLVSMSMTVVGFLYLVSDATFQTVLTRRQRRLDRWAPTVFGMSLACGLASGALIAAAAPVAVWFYDEPRLAGLLYVQATVPPVAAFSVLPLTYAQARLRFRLFATATFLRTTAQIVLSVVLAALGFGPYSFVIPAPLAYAVVAVVLWPRTRPPVRPLRPRWPRWRALAGDVATLAAATFFVGLVSLGDYVMLGRFHDAAAVGVYFFAYNMSQQTFFLLSSSFANVLRPALGQFAGDPVRQTRAYLRAARVMAAVLVPACVLQAALADAGVRLLFPARWYDAIPLLQVLSLGWTTQAVSATAYALIEAQGRFRLNLVLRATYGAVFLTAVGAAAARGGPFAVAATVATYSFFLAGLFHLYVAVRKYGGGPRDVAAVFVTPLVLGLGAAAAPVLVARAVPLLHRWPVIELAFVGGATVALYAALLRRVAPALWGELGDHLPLGRVRGLIGRVRVRGRNAATATATATADPVGLPQDPRP